MKENQEINYIPTTEGLKALYEYQSKSMELIFDSIMGRDNWESALNDILPREKVEPREKPNE